MKCGREITWEQMKSLHRKDIAPFTFVFTLDEPCGEDGRTAFTRLVVKRFKGDWPVVECQGEEFVAEDARAVYAEVCTNEEVA